ncbi:LacI family DNA-binding transcriptional regulator [Aestuariivirga litoralis]|uniref:LacI family DNA-binding transcriptional regulator n=1 Tax=Aestuariivirga litoralis TaxID=2650924 RepID=UPI0018C58078|nr:LacI family DNA-binding transcriptional regulator [Aestuariivirga litoralis]MBG1233252.1 LacI family transcriptional regulator [Aestuariivirga litoralis]
MATIRDVAKAAGLAISTVSAVINRSAPVSEDAIKRVEKAVEAVGYIPNGAARSLRSGKSSLIGLLVPNVANPIFSAVAREVEHFCFERGYTSVVFSTGQDADREAQILKMMRMHRVGGLVIIPTRSDAQHGAKLRAMIHVPTVLLDMFVEGLPFDVVKTDNVEAGRIATEHLLSLGHRRIGIIVGIPGLATSDDRFEGFIRAHASAGLEVDNDLVIAGQFDTAGAHEAALELLARPNPPTAIVTISNLMTTGLLFALKEKKIRVPEQLSIIGIDELDFSELLDPVPTVVATPVIDMARRTIEMLLAEIEGGEPPAGKWELWKPKLLQRNSTAPTG